MFSIFFIRIVSAQSFFKMEDSLSTKRLIPVSIGIGAVWGGSIAALSNIWYDQYEKTSFHTFNDAGEWLQMDKAGHIYSSYHLTSKSYDLYRWSGLSLNQSVLFGTITGLGYQTSLELLDGKSSGWGFSWNDMLANGIGSMLFSIQQLAINDQFFMLKFSASYSKYAKIRPDVLGNTFAERILKDYNGQTYWLSFSPKSVFPNSRVPLWLCLSFGYSVDGKISAFNDGYVYNNEFITAQREFLFSLDLDLTKLNVRKPWLKALLKQVNVLKIPFPTIGLRGNNLIFRGLYF